MIKTGDARSTVFFDDLPAAIERAEANGGPTGEWRVHFHVPVFLDHFGHLQTTQAQVIDCLGMLRSSDVRHFEVETYAWDVLPDDLQAETLAEGIAREMQWVVDQS